MGSFKNYITSFWKGLLSLLKGMGVTGKYFFSRKVTEQYPENRATLKIPERFRGTLTLIYDKYRTQCTCADELPEWDNQNRGFENYHRRW